MSLARRYMEQAAQYVADHPERFYFIAAEVPRFKDSYGCALGWTAYFMNQEQGFFRRLFNRPVNSIDVAARRLGYRCDNSFYRAMDLATFDCGINWRKDAAVCALGLRRLARRYAETA